MQCYTHVTGREVSCPVRHAGTRDCPVFFFIIIKTLGTYVRGVDSQTLIEVPLRRGSQAGCISRAQYHLHRPPANTPGILAITSHGTPTWIYIYG